MPIIAGDWYDEEGAAFMEHQAFVDSTFGGRYCRRTHPRPWTKETTRQQKARNSFTTAVRTWTETMPPVPQATWTGSPPSFWNRKGTPVAGRPFLAFMNVNVPLAMAAQPLIYERNIEFDYTVNAVTLNALSVANQQAQIKIEFGRWKAGTIITIVHISQVDPAYVDHEDFWKYTKYLKSLALYTDVFNPPWTYKYDWSNMPWPFASGDQVQLYVRITHQYDWGSPPFAWEPFTMTWDPGPLILTAP